MTNLHTFVKEERGDVEQFIIVLAVIAIILAFTFPKIKAKMSDATTKTTNNITTSNAAM